MLKRTRKPVATTLLDLLADTLTASKHFLGKYGHYRFRFDYGNIQYEPEEDTKLRDLEFSCPQNDNMPFCCGITVFGGFEDRELTADSAVNAVLMRIFAAYTVKISNCNFLISTVVRKDQPRSYAALLGAGFEEISSFISKNTGNRITVLHYERLKVKELPIS